ncbi:MAG: T9SS type A sorting domain-containing protein [Bacteroidota bacterium]
MKKNTFLYLIFSISFLLLISAQIVFAQASFTKTYGTTGWDEAYSINIDSGGNFIIAGSAAINNYDIYLIKTNSDGDTLWTKNYGGAGDDGAYACAITNDEGFIMAGWTDGPLSAGNYDMYVVKVDNSGILEWEYAFGTASKEWANDVVQSPDGGYLIAGFSHVSVSEKYAYAVKLKSNGDTLWTKIGFTTDTNKIQELNSAYCTSDGGFILCGIEYDIPTNRNNVLLIKIDSIGIIEWSETYGGSVNHMGFDVIEIPDGYAVAGKLFVSTTYKPLLLKTDTAGNQTWKKDYSGSTEYDEIFGLETTNDNGFLLTGKYRNGNKDVFIIKTDNNGDQEWARTFGGSGLDIGYDGKQTDDGGFVIVGSTTSEGAGNEDFYLIKTDATGQICDNFPTITVSTNIESQGNPTVFTPIITGGNGNLTFSWTGDDGFSSTDSIPSYIFPSGAGIYYYSVTVTDNNSCVGTYCGTTQVVLCSGLMMVTCSSDTVTAGSYTQFDMSVSNGIPPFSFQWSGDDGFSSTDSTPTYVYPSGAGTYNYSVTVTDSDSCQTSCSGIAVVATSDGIEDNLEFNIKIYPNPFNSSLTIYFNNENPVIADLSIFNTLGQKVYCDKIKSTTNYHKINFSNPLAAGIYTLSLKTNNELIYKKIIKYQ